MDQVGLLQQELKNMQGKLFKQEKLYDKDVKYVQIPK
eukprot:gene17329-23525_t